MDNSGSILLQAVVLVLLVGFALVLLVGIVWLIRKMSVQDIQPPAPPPVSRLPNSAVRPLGIEPSSTLEMRVERGLPLPSIPQPAPPASTVLPQDLQGAVIELLRSGKKINAIALYRQVTNAGLKEARDAVEEIDRGRKHIN